MTIVKRVIILSLWVAAICDPIFACPPTIIENQTKEPVAQEVVDAAKKVCKTRYKKCLKKLIKRPGDQNYWAICGGAIE